MKKGCSYLTDRMLHKNHSGAELLIPGEEEIGAIAFSLVTGENCPF
jgi:hypothetical protein